MCSIHGEERSCYNDHRVSHFYPPKTFWQELSLFNATFTDEGFNPLFLAPFWFCPSLSLLCVVLLQGWTMAPFMAIAYALAQICRRPPYSLIVVTSFAVSSSVLLMTRSSGSVRAEQGHLRAKYRLVVRDGTLYIRAVFFGFGYNGSNRLDLVLLLFTGSCYLVQRHLKPIPPHVLSMRSET